jgi:nucleoid-associated protein YgaU
MTGGANMTNRTLRAAVLMTAASLLLLADLPLDGTTSMRLGREAAAVVGAPLTPVSAAGVARRTTRRVVAVEATAASSATAATAQQQQAVAQQQAATAQQQAATAQQQAAVAQQQAAAAPAIGSVVTALPAGCAAMSKGGVEYHQCGNVFYRAAFQGNNLVYAVVPQP